MPNAQATVLIAGGKTGGHLFPGIAVAEELKKRGVRVVFIGTRGGLEEKELPERGWPVEFISAGGLKGKGIFDTIKNLAILPFGLLQSLSLMGKYRADGVVSLGGFAAGPAALAARMRGKKVFVMEQNSIPGITNKTVGRFADRIYLTFPDEKAIFDAAKCQLTGNPVRSDIFAAEPRQFETVKPKLAIFGGSQGATSLNYAIIYTLKKYPDLAKAFYFIHQTGERDFEAVEQVYKELGAEYVASRFIRDIGRYYKAADFIVCRAGATTIAELIALKKPAIYVPFPHAADNHQFFNAAAIAKRGGGIVVEDQGSDTNKGKKLYSALIELRDNREKYERAMRENFGENNAAALIADDIMKSLGTGK